jgi:acetyltransferase-like isoleucine patch superfamily enzyme
MFVRFREFIRLFALYFNYFYMVRVLGMRISPSSRVSWGAILDKVYPTGIFIEDESYVASGARILTHDFCRGLKCETRIGKRCFIGADAIVMPGVVVSDSVIVGAGAVVTKNVPPQTIVAGNPAKVVRSGIRTVKWGQLSEEDILRKSWKEVL